MAHPTLHCFFEAAGLSYGQPQHTWRNIRGSAIVLGGGILENSSRRCAYCSGVTDRLLNICHSPKQSLLPLT